MSKLEEDYNLKPEPPRPDRRIILALLIAAGAVPELIAVFYNKPFHQEFALVTIGLIIWGAGIIYYKYS